MGGNGTPYSYSNIDKAYAHIDGLNGQPGYFTDSAQPRPYAMLSADKTAVTFYYDTLQPTRQAAAENTGATFIYKFSDRTWVSSSLIRVSFDDSFKNFHGLTSTAAWFRDCSQLMTIEGLTNLNTAGVTSMESMFSDCHNLTAVDLSNFNTANVTSMYNMFYYCQALTEIDLRSFSIENLSNTSQMFFYCSNLESIYAPAGTDWNASTTLSNSTNMFYYCSNLMGGNSTAYNPSYTNQSYARIDGLGGTAGYFTDPDAFLLGDVNKDGAITIADVTALVNIILGKDTAGTYDQRAADVNTDGTITIADVTALVNIILGKN